MKKQKMKKSSDPGIFIIETTIEERVELDLLEARLITAQAEVDRLQKLIDDISAL